MALKYLLKADSHNEFKKKSRYRLLGPNPKEGPGKKHQTKDVFDMFPLDEEEEISSGFYTSEETVEEDPEFALVYS